jgi:hypothetical protein
MSDATELVAIDVLNAAQATGEPVNIASAPNGQRSGSPGSVETPGRSVKQAKEKKL